MEKRVLYGLEVMLMYLVGSGSSQGAFGSPPPPAYNPLSQIESLVKFDLWQRTLVTVQLPKVVMVTASLCGAPCVILEDQVAQLAKTYGDQIIFYRNNILENPFFAKLYKVANVPNVLVFKDGEVLIRYENLSDWGKFYDLLVHSSIFGSDSDAALPPSDSDADFPLAPQSGE